MENTEQTSGEYTHACAQVKQANRRAAADARILVCVQNWVEGSEEGRRGKEDGGGEERGVESLCLG